MKNTYILAFITILVFSQNSFSQNYRDVFDEKYNQSKDSAKVYSDQLIQSKKSNERAFGFVSKAYVITKEGNYEEAESLLNLGFEELKKIRQTSLRSEEKLYALYYKLQLFAAKHEFDSISEKINQGIQLSKEVKLPKMQIKFENLDGRVLSLWGKGDEAIVKGAITIKSIQSLRSQLSESYYQNELFTAYLNTSGRALNYYVQDSTRNTSYLDSTASYLTKAKRFVEQEGFTPSKTRQRQMLATQSDVFYRRKNYYQALVYYQKTLEASEALGLKKRVYQTKFRIAECHFYLKEYLKAKQLFDVFSSEDLQQYILLKNQILIKFYYAGIYSELEDTKKALKYIDTFNMQTDEFYKKMSSTKFNLLAKRELAEKQRILEESARKSEENKRLKTYGWIAFAIFLLIVSMLAIYIRRQKRRFHVKLKLLIERLENSEKKPTPHIRVDEQKAQKIIEELKKIEEQELFLSPSYSLNMVAKKIDSNSSYVSQIINTYWNKSFVQYTNELRINYILLKLKEDRMYQKFTLTAIAESAGYKSVISFNKHFKSIAGITPKQYLQYVKTL